MAERPILEAGGTHPVSEWERKLQVIWSEVLGRADVGCEENFFEAGGDSIQLGIVHARVVRAAERDLPMTDLFAHPTIRALARQLEGAGGGAEEARQRALKQRQAIAARNPRLTRA